LAQKQRLAVLAKMGVGPIAPPVERSAPRTEIRDSIGGPPPVDRRAILLERERRMRDQEEKQREEEEKLLEEKQRKKKTVKFSGLSRLGPVMPREEDIPQFLPAPAQEPEPRRYRDERAEHAKANEPEDEREDAGQKALATPKQDKKRAATEEEQMLRLLREHKQQQQQQQQNQHQQQQQLLQQQLQQLQQGPRKKKKKKVREDGGEWQGEDEDWDEEERQDDPQQPPLPLPLPRKRDGGISKQTMVVESVKGKVSHANKNLTDADLERRFPLFDSGGSGGPLMSEEEVLRLIRKERKEKGSSTGSAARRVQRELAEWENAKEVQRARVKSPHRFERMVVARK